MHATTFKTKVVAGVTGALLALATAGVFSYRHILDADADARWVAHTHLVIETLDSLLTDLIDSETGERGFLLTGNNAYLQPYTAALQHLNSDFAFARHLTADNPRQQRRLGRIKPLIATELAGMRNSIEIRKKHRLLYNPGSVQPGAEKRRMDQIRSLIAQMKQEEKHLLQQREEAAASASRETRLVILGGSLLGLLLLSAAGLVIYRELDKRTKAESALFRSEQRFRLMVTNVQDYAIFLLDPEGHVLSWNAGAERLKGYKSEEIIGRHFSFFYTPEARQAGLPESVLERASREGHATTEGWRVRKDGSRLWANVSVTALRDETGNLQGFGKVTRDLTERRRAEEEIRVRNAQLEASNKELEAFCYSVSHDLRAPLRSIDGFSQALLEDQADQIDDAGKDYLHRIRRATQRMGVLIDDLLNLSRVTRAEIAPKLTNLSEMARSVADDLSRQDPNREVEFVVGPDLQANADPRLIRVVLENLLSNAWKFTSKREHARIEFGRTDQNGSSAFFVRDNGAGFDPAYSNRLFGAFQRLHSMQEFPGTGIGLATVERIIHRHGGKVWAEGKPDRGATLYFQL